MARLSLFLFCLNLNSIVLLGQERDTIIYDFTTDNYIVRYKATLPFARRSNGALRRLTIEDSMLPGEQYVEIDSTFTIAWEPATKIEPIIFCSVIGFSVTEKAYSYRLINTYTSKQDLLSFVIQFGNGVQLRSGSDNRWFNGQMYEGGAQRRTNRWSWIAAGEKVAPIAPGDSLGGFLLITSALPGLGKGYFDGRRAQITEFPGGGPKGDVGRKLSQLRQFPNAYVSRSTIVPVNGPTPFSHLAFLDTLLSYTRQSAELGWLGRDRDNDYDNDEKPEDGIVRNIEQRLNKAKRQLERGDSILTRRELEKLVGKVERLWKRSQEDDKKDKRDRWEKKDKVVMTSEAYALLKYNTEYLIDRLPDRKPKKGSKDKD